jgi:hypothetical protein
MTDTTNPNPPLPDVGQMAWGDQLNSVLGDLQRRVSALEGTHPQPPDPGMIQYVYDGTEAPPTGDGVITMNAIQSAATTIWIALIDANGIDRTTDLATIASGTILGLAQTDDANKWQQYYCVGPAVIGATYATLGGPVHWNAGTNIDTGAMVDVHITAPSAVL